MDVHLWAKLDREGRLESVQSSCTQPSSESSPVLPVTGQNGGNIEEWKNSSAISEKFVPYLEKKDLVYKLDAKVDEMGLIIMQMAELNKRVKLQEKLIDQYEEKLGENKKKITALEKENEELKRRKVSRCKSSSLNTKMVNRPNAARPSSWPIDSRVTYSYDQQDGMGVNSFDHSKSETLHRDDDKVGGAEALLNDQRPSSLGVSLGISNFSVPNTDNREECILRCQVTSGHGMYSYVNVNTTRSQFSLENEELKKTNDSTAEIKTRTCSIGPQDPDGYLDMNHMTEIYDKTESVYSFGKEVEENVHFDNHQFDGACQSCENEAIHSTWIDVKNGNFITRQNDTASVCEDYMDLTDNNHDYVCIQEEDLQDNYSKPPLPNRRTSRIHRSNTDTTFDGRFTGSQTCPKDLSNGEIARDRSSSLPDDPFYNFLPKSQGKDGKQRKLVKSRSSYSFERVKHQEIVPERRSLGNEVKKDDDLNKVLKDMRTTMEWNKSKKKLISKSHHNTVDNVEKRLKSTVQAVYGTYTSWYGDHRSSSKKFSKEKLLQKMKENMGKPDTDDLQCDDFMSKCLDLVHRTVQTP